MTDLGKVVSIGPKVPKVSKPDAPFRDNHWLAYCFFQEHKLNVPRSDNAFLREMCHQYMDVEVFEPAHNVVDAIVYTEQGRPRG